MADRDYLPLLDACKTLEDLLAQIKEALRDPRKYVPGEEGMTEWSRVPGATFKYGSEKRLDPAGLKVLYDAFAAAAVRIQVAEGIPENVPLGESDPCHGILRIEQWCAKAGAQAKAEQPTEEPPGKPAPERATELVDVQVTPQAVQGEPPAKDLPQTQDAEHKAKEEVECARREAAKAKRARRKAEKALTRERARADKAEQDRTAATERAKAPQAGGNISSVKIRVPREPSKIETQAYNLYWSTGRSQADIAAMLTAEHKPEKAYSQGSVSRMVNRVHKWRESSGLPIEEAATRANQIPVDPKTEDMGKRTDGRGTGDPRHKRDQDEEE